MLQILNGGLLQGGKKEREINEFGEEYSGVSSLSCFISLKKSVANMVK